jgi:hypothetical protein
MNKYTWNSIEREKKGLDTGEQQWDETQQQIAQALLARWTGAVNKGLNNKRLRELIIMTGKGNKHTSNTMDLLVKLTIIRWKHAKERIDLHEAYYWMDREEEIMWAKDKLCFQHLALNEMKRSTNADNWVAGMTGTKIEVARTIEAWMQRIGGIEAETSKWKRDFHQHFPTDISKSSQLHQAYWKECTMQRERTPEMDHIDRPRIARNEHEKRVHKLSHQEQQDLIATPWDIWERKENEET